MKPESDMDCSVSSVIANELKETTEAELATVDTLSYELHRRYKEYSSWAIV